MGTRRSSRVGGSSSGSGSGVSVIITCQEEEGPSDGTENLTSEEYDQLVKVLLLLRVLCKYVNCTGCPRNKKLHIILFL